MADDEPGSRWRTKAAPPDAPTGGCLYCNAEHTAEQRGMVALISTLYGHLIRVETPDGQWLVPREYISLHGLVAFELPLLAELYDWTKVA